MNWLMFVVLLALAWYSYDSGLGFFAFLLVIAAVLLAFTQQQEKEAAREEYSAQSAPGQPIVMESGSTARTGEVRIKVKKWRDRWEQHPQEYTFLHFGFAMNNIARSILYVLGIEKDE